MKIKIIHDGRELINTDNLTRVGDKVLAYDEKGLAEIGIEAVEQDAVLAIDYKLYDQRGKK